MGLIARKHLKGFITRTVFLILILSPGAAVYAQGCSDAGFCSIHSVKPEDEGVSDFMRFNNTFKAGLSFGNTRYDVWIVNPYAEYTRYLSEKLLVSLKINGVHRTGQLTSVTGFSDAIMTTSFAIFESTRAIAGLKIPFNDANKRFQGRSMPMAYQTSLGTFDGIVGLQRNLGNFMLAAAWQQPLIQNNNGFLPLDFSLAELGHVYPGTNSFKRAGDVLLRVSYSHRLKKHEKLSLIYSMLPIYHLKNDSYVDKDGDEIILFGSKGLTLNINAFVKYKWDEKTEVEFSTGFPVMAREVRPEGLSQFALTLEFSRKF